MLCVHVWCDGVWHCIVCAFVGMAICVCVWVVGSGYAYMVCCVMCVCLLLYYGGRVYGIYAFTCVMGVCHVALSVCMCLHDMILCVRVYAHRLCVCYMVCVLLCNVML